MEEHDVWRSRARASLEAYFRRRSFPRLTLSLLLLLTGLTGFLISYAMLELGMQHMWVRYPIATLGSYCLLLALIRGGLQLSESPSTWWMPQLLIDETNSHSETEQVSGQRQTCRARADNENL